MSYKSKNHLKGLGTAKRTQLFQSHVSVGYHPETEDTLLISDNDRYAGTYLLGVQGVGKSGLLENLIAADVAAGKAVIVIDPHGDLIDTCIAMLPEEKLAATHLLNMADEEYPFGVNIFAKLTAGTAISEAQGVDRVMHIFEVLWKDVLSQQHLPRYLRAAILTLLANGGSNLFDIYRLLLDDALRHRMLQAVADHTVSQFWQTQFDDLPMSMRIQRVSPLLNRLESLFMGRSLVRNILSQAETTIDFRTAIEEKQIIFVKLPIKTLEQDARLIGTFLIAQIHAALFSFADMPEADRPGFSLYVDEFQHFATPDFNELFTEGRKFGSRVTVAHQYRGQLPDYLQASTMTARTKVCFQMVPEDARKMASVFPEQQTLRPEDMDTHPVEHLLRYGSDDETVQRFIDVYLRPLHTQPHKNGKIEIITPGIHFDNYVDNAIRGALGLPKNREHPTVNDPLPFLNHLLYDVMKNGNPERPIPLNIAYGFSNCGNGFYPSLRWTLDKQTLLSSRVTFPPYLVVEGADGLRWTRLPEGHKEQLYNFLFYLRQTMRWLAAHPIGRKTTLSTFDIAHMLTQLPRRAPFVRSGDDAGVIYTHDTP